ncbi:MAG TPA: transcription termination/antitermination NusG family protein, partial [Chthoniobacteraceae bacterium]|nr:transcription termination/antitermination NusG family protein [Chthoniobacteraceae bacterium]
MNTDQLRFSNTKTGGSPPAGANCEEARRRADKDSLLRDINWFAIHTKPRREAYAETSVRVLGHDVFLPRIKVERDGMGTAQVSSKPLFRGYFFARFCPEASLEPVKCARGVLQVVSSGRFPIPVDDAVIREIQDRVEADGYITIRRRALAPGDLVSIEEGPFQGMMGR